VQPVPQPLDRRAGDEDGAFERTARLLVLEPCGGGAQDAVPGRLVGLDEDERAGAVRRFRTARREERCLLVAGDSLNRQRAAEQLALAEVRARRLDLRQQLTANPEKLEQLVVPVERLERAKERARGIRLVGGVHAAARELPDEPGVDGAECEVGAVVLAKEPLELRR
jgi:hypothetical protein